MTRNAEDRNTLCISGISLPAENAAASAQLASLSAHWDIQLNEDFATRHEIAWFDRLWFWTDRKLFGRGRWAVNESSATPHSCSKVKDAQNVDAELDWSGRTPMSTTAPAVRVEYDGLPPALLAQAVRGRIGQVGGVLPFVVFVRTDSRGFLPRLSGALRLDHRSIHRSIVMCANKLPQMLHAALRRTISGLPTVSVAEDNSTPVSLPVLGLRQLVGVVRWLIWREQWIIEVYRKMGSESNVDLVQTLRPPDSAFWADPFLARINGRVLLFFEELPFETMRGHISAIELNEEGIPVGPTKTVLQEPWHLSYPFIWQEGNEALMIPESGESRSLRAYKSVDDGSTWTLVDELMHGVRLADATVIRCGGRLWLFATQSDVGASMDDALCLWFADELTGPWRPHRLNPVKVDARNSRPAGRMWIENGEIYRVVQDCSTTYGGSTVCMRVLQLTPDEFEEEVVTDWTGSAFASRDPWHTYNTLDSLIVVDRLVQIARWKRLRLFQADA